MLVVAMLMRHHMAIGHYHPSAHDGCVGGAGTCCIARPLLATERLALTDPDHVRYTLKSV
jgi:hypothetical protein